MKIDITQLIKGDNGSKKIYQPTLIRQNNVGWDFDQELILNV